MLARTLSQKPHIGPKISHCRSSWKKRSVSRWRSRKKPQLKVRCTSDETLPGQYYDEETNLHYNYFRDYDPSTGRYIESDPVGFEGGLNTYIYVNNNPIFWIDPLGLIPKCFRGVPRVVVSTDTAKEVKIITSFHMLHPENYRPSAGGSYPGGSSPPIGPQLDVDWWLWEHTLKQFSEFEITKTMKITTIWCEEERNCETIRFNYEDIEETETKRLINKFMKWFHKRLYWAGSNSWPLP